MNIQGVIFDLDGTLIDSLEDIGDAMNHILAKYGLPRHSLDKYRYFVGDGLDNLVKRSLPPELVCDKNVSFYLSEFKSLYGEHCLDKTAPYPGILNMLQYLWKNNIHTAVFSNKSDEFTKHIVNSIFPGHEFETVSGAGNAILKKPDPAEAIRIMKSWKIDSAECLFVGDLPVDVETAHRSGMLSVAVTWGFRGGSDTRILNPDFTVSEASEIISIISKKNEGAR